MIHISSPKGWLERDLTPISSRLCQSAQRGHLVKIVTCHLVKIEILLLKYFFKQES